MKSAGVIGRTMGMLVSFISTGLIILSALLLILSICFLLHSPPVFTEEPKHGDSEAFDAIDEELRYLKTCLLGE